MRQQKENQPTKAVIYCRVSSVAQLKKGDGLSSQESRCREYARYKDYAIEQVFAEQAVSGDTLDRPELQSLIAYLKANKGSTPIIVIIDDINRLSRDVVVHWQLRALLAEAGGKLESPSIEFGEDSDSILVENLLASVSQHQRQKNGEQTKNRMRGRALNGYWPFRAPPGLKFKRIAGHGNLLVRDEPLASIIQEAFEGFASGRFETQGEVKRFLESQPDYPKDLPNGTIRYESVIRLFRRTLYAGYLEIPQWDVSLREGKHQGLVSYQTFHSVHEKISERTKTPVRHDISTDFPLRGFVACGCCGKPLTSNWSRSKTGKRHPYYICFNKDCEMKGKSIQRAEMEGAFDDLLQSLQPNPSMFVTVRDMFKRAWAIRGEQATQVKDKIESQITAKEAQITRLLDRIVATDNDRLVESYEAKLSQLEKDKLILAEKLQNQAQKPRQFDAMFELALSFLSNPWKLWENGSLTMKRVVLRLVFPRRIRYQRGEGFRTPQVASPFGFMANIAQKCKMAERQGFEPWRRLPAYTLSRRAPSTTRPPLHCSLLSARPGITCSLTRSQALNR